MYAETVGSDDAPDLVCLHGGIGTGRYHWSKQLKVLEPLFGVHLPDLPGHGRTPLPADGSYSREVLVRAVQEYLAGFDRPVHVAGFSMGGHTSLALAQSRPELFASLVLVGVSVRDHDGLHHWRKNFDPDVLAETYPLWARQLAKLHEPLGGPDAWREVCRRDSSGLEVEVDLGRLRGLDVPVLLVRGDRDQVAPPEQYAELREVWPQAEEFVVPGGGHDVQLTRNGVVRPVLADFYKRLLDRS